MRSALQRNVATGIVVERKKPWRSAEAAFNWGGRSVFRLVDETHSWRDTVASVLQPLLLTPAHTDLAFIRIGSHLANSWSDVHVINPMPGGLNPDPPMRVPV